MTCNIIVVNIFCNNDIVIAKPKWHLFNCKTLSPIINGILYYNFTKPYYFVIFFEDVLIFNILQIEPYNGDCKIYTYNLTTTYIIIYWRYVYKLNTIIFHLAFESHLNCIQILNVQIYFCVYTVFFYVLNYVKIMYCTSYSEPILYIFYFFLFILCSYSTYFSYLNILIQTVFTSLQWINAVLMLSWNI